jgi:Membrane bound O-acyl transferase family
MAILIYKFIVQRRRIDIPSSKSKKDDDMYDRDDRQRETTAAYSNGTATMMNAHRMPPSNYTLPIASYILGWGCIIPISFYLPYEMLYHLRILNASVRMSTGTSAIIVAYRCIEAMYHTSPHTVEYDIYTYMTYYSSLLHFQWNPITHQRRLITIRELIVNVGYFVFTWAALSMLLSYLMHYDFLPFGSPIQDIHNFHFNFDIFHFGHIGNMYLLAVLTYLTLSFGLEITSIGEQIKGHYTEPIFYNPLFGSRSPSDFWNRRWNNMIHTILKYGTFYPAQRFVSKRLALFVTFLMSGFIHEYSWSLMFYHHPDDSGEPVFVPLYTKLTAFFAWNGIVTLLERPLAPFVQPITSKLPTLIVSTLVVLTVLPVSHWFTGDWVAGNFFNHLSHGLCVIRKV